jgi:hypothetical protein
MIFSKIVFKIINTYKRPCISSRTSNRLENCPELILVLISTKILNIAKNDSISLNPAFVIMHTFCINHSFSYVYLSVSYRHKKYRSFTVRNISNLLSLFFRLFRPASIFQLHSYILPSILSFFILCRIRIRRISHT